jgi:hypothetical protein
VSNTVNCCECSNPIPKKNCFAGIEDDVICGTCIKKQYGQGFYEWAYNSIFGDWESTCEDEE